MVLGATCLHGSGLWKVRQSLWVMEEEVEEETGDWVGFSPERAATSCGGGMRLLELFDAQSRTRSVLIVMG